MRVVDFDAARAERRDPVILKAFGGEYPIPSGPPVGFILLSTEMGKGADEEFSEDETVQLLKAAVGENTYDQLVKAGLEPEDVVLLIEMIGVLWRGGEKGEAPAPAEGAGSDT